MADDLDELARMLASPIDDLTDAQLIDALRLAERIRAAGRERTGRLLAELHARGRSWPRIARDTGIRQTTAYDWARPYLRPDPGVERSPREGDPSG